MQFQWQDMASLNRKYNSMYMAGLGATGRGLGAEPPGGSNFWWNIQVNVNDWLGELGRERIEETEEPDVPTCAALQWLLEHMPEDAHFREFVDEPANRQYIDAGCSEATAGMETLPVPSPVDAEESNDEPSPPEPSAEEPKPVESSDEACSDGTCDCYVFEGDRGEHIAWLQKQLNAALDAEGYEPIEVTGVYDPATCGAIFELRGSFEPDYPALCDNVEGEWVVPLECPDMVLPKKTSKASLFAIGGLVLAAGLGAAYWVSKR